MSAEKTERLTMAQALVRFLAAQQVERDGAVTRFFPGCFGIFGHGNLAGMGQALDQYAALLPYHPARNEQGMVHIAVGYARMRDRLATFACTSSIGPGATNMVTGAALATVNRIPVLLLPGDVFASRLPDPVLQQLEDPSSGDVTVNDAFRAVSKYWDRISRPEQLIPAALSAMRVLTSPAETGAVTLCLPQDVQTEAHDYPAEFLAERVWHIERRPPDPAALARAVEAIRASRRPLIVAGGGVIYSGATDALARFAQATGIPVAETQAGKGALRYGRPGALGAIGATGTLPANRIARDADLVIGIGTRWSDFTTASKSAFAADGVRFVNINVAEGDVVKQSGIAVTADARAALEALGDIAYRVDDGYRAEIAGLTRDWDTEVERLYDLEHQPHLAQSAVIGAVERASAPADVVICAAGSMPGDLHKLWRTRDPKGYHVEYGYSCMGYEIAGGIGVKLAAPEREVYVLVGDGSYLMLPGELVTAIQEGVKLTVILVESHGYASIGALSRSLGSDGFGTQLRDSGGAVMPIDLAANAASLGATVIRAATMAELRAALERAKGETNTVVIHVEVDPAVGVPGYESWWDVAVAEVSTQERVQEARARSEDARRRQRRYL
ncbi:MAG TPA: 3D-(3,5/4)-trihydroxycyclohexane-1,2-dione acylhydrolase (decyclizing) [Candidatus Saccharimonadales bacterium]|nr:3D-(3,5/4)-trihydroxycyclohexane-1,2-dione acylhydrolase (decyclizing) [Candidatus Saccharimonadales bacterium]